MIKVKQTHNSIKYMDKRSIMFGTLLKEAGLKSQETDHDGRMIYECKIKPRDCKQAFIYFESI